jgi:hypothetical protein
LAGPERLDDGQKRKIAEFYAAGKTIPELAEEYGCGVGTIWRSFNPKPGRRYKSKWLRCGRGD